MSCSQSRGSLISVRCVVADHYQAEPIPGLDPLVSDFTGYNIRKVPIIRVFGSTSSGQRACLHIHGIFPYLYIPLPEGEKEGFVYRLASSLDKAINISMQQGRATIQHVYKAVKVSGIPMYGYHPRQHTFVKIFFYNPFMVKRAAELLQGGAVLNKILQPHESHTNMVLQFMIDYNLQGMNMINLSHAMFRQGQHQDEYDEMESIIEPPWVTNRVQSRPRSKCSLDASLFPEDNEPQSVISQYMKIDPEQRYFYVDELEDCLKLSADVKRQSTTELELDAVAADIINHQDASGAAMNPGLVALWDDERERRLRAGMSDPVTPPSSPPRDPSVHERSESERFWYERLSQVIEVKKSNEEPNTSPDYSDPDATIHLIRPQTAASSGSAAGHVYAMESSDHDLTHLPGATQLDPHIQSLSDSLLNATGMDSTSLNQTVPQVDQSCYGEDTIVDEELILSQMQNEDSSGDEVDEELVELLADLATDKEESRNESEKTPTKTPSLEEDDVFKTPSFPSQRKSQGSAKKLSQAVSEALKQNEEDESHEMSQFVWETQEDWDDLDKTLMENFAKDLDSICDNQEEEDIEDMFA